MKSIKAKKRYGQNFLKDESILAQIIQAIPKDDHHIVEVGPGLGDLTKHLLKNNLVIAYEIDRGLFAHLEKRFVVDIKTNRLKLTNTDVLKQFDKGSLCDTSYNLVANLPYNIATNVLFRAFEDDNCRNILVMVQKEVADKFLANVTDKSYSPLAIICQHMCSSRKKIADVPKECFTPSPKVSSTVIYLQKFEKTVTISQQFKQFLKICFNSNRKTILNNLCKSYDKLDILAVLDSLSIKPNKRPHEVSRDQYDRIYEKIKEKYD
jgi:16S rRNA (adenine1518-N6/adenine1519-N6)-dimethyltransferase